VSIECKNAPQCAPAKHHYDDCAARVQKQESEGEVTEDCVEECTSFFTLSTCLALEPDACTWVPSEL
jgi:ubiquinol-cytochrome c reductase subunit 6